MDALVDGAPAERLPLDERALQYGDGLFETVAVAGGLPCLWHAHMARLSEGSERLRLPPPPAALLAAEAAMLCRPGVDAVLKIYWTAGDSERGYRRDRPLRPRRIVKRAPWQRTPSGATWTVRLCEHRHGDNPHLAGIKHLNRLDQVLARAEWDDPAVEEGLMLGQDGRLVSGTASNLFVQLGTELLTPPLTGAGIDGVVRRLVIDGAAGSDRPVRVAPMLPETLARADAVYLTNSVAGPVRVAAFEGTRFDLATDEHPAIAAARANCHRPDRRWPA